MSNWEAMNVEENRLKTFSQWPANAAVDAARIAKAGFFYAGRALEAQCFLCGTIISDWNYGDQAMSRHRQAAPSCPFVQNPNNTCNVPLVPTSDSPPSVASSSAEALPVNDRVGNQNGPPLVRSKDPRREFGTIPKRLRSFAKWPKPNMIPPEVLAITGFYYLQWSDAVECAFCGCTIMNWTDDTDMDKIHREFLPKCDFYVAQNENAQLDLRNVIIRPGTTEDHAELGIRTHAAPRVPKYATYEERLRTFTHWPETLKQTPDMLARAGFYYAGFEDLVRCFYCDGGLRNWEATDDAWTEHATWFPKCGYVNLVQGSAFVKQCIENRPPLDPTIFEGVPEEENAEVVATPPASISTILPPCQEITDATVQRLLHSSPAMEALEAGLDVSRVKRALVRRIQQVGVPYESADQLIEDIFVHAQEEEDSHSNQTPDSPSSELTTLLNHVMSEEENNAAPQISESETTDATLEIRESNRTDVATSGEMKAETSDSGSEAAAISPTAKGKSVETLLLEEENRRLKEARLCKICMDWEVSVVFLPCGHLATCVYCAPSLTCCPMCRQEIGAVVRTFVS